MESSLLDSVVFTVGLLAALRSKTHGGKVIGVMITASHNPAKDNGVKLVEPLGEMLVQSWESYATDLANAPDVDTCISVLEKIIEKEKIDLSVPAKVVVGRDTRPSGASLVEALKDGVAAFSGAITDYGLQTTPQLHYVTRCLNTEGTPAAYGIPTDEGYFSKLATAFKKITSGKAKQSTLKVDCANGIGATALKGLVKHLGDSLSVQSYNEDTASAEKLNKDKIPVVFTPTGVKHLHHEAEHFDVGVYFEANGHGTVLFSEAAQKSFKTTQGQTDAQRESLAILQALSEVINQAVGDALSDMLMVEAILACQSKSLPKWDTDYTDLPSRQEKVKVQRRSDFVPIKADTELAAPAGLQDRINAEVAKYSKGRCFVRPSGTEDIVRVYAEAATREETEKLTYTVCGIVFDHYGGVGERPAKFL
ncbi:Phosphoacetylglucosamine Mutase [Phlyctochytrium bullatum]|nr:Phosphoacetylglucosamine Mutase [Phlyctochytrium bullatum]